MRSEPRRYLTPNPPHVEGVLVEADARSVPQLTASALGEAPLSEGIHAPEEFLVSSLMGTEDESPQLPE